MKKKVNKLSEKDLSGSSKASNRLLKVEDFNHAESAILLKRGFVRDRETVKTELASEIGAGSKWIANCWSKRTQMKPSAALKHIQKKRSSTKPPKTHSQQPPSTHDIEAGPSSHPDWTVRAPKKPQTARKSTGQNLFKLKFIFSNYIPLKTMCYLQVGRGKLKQNPLQSQRDPGFLFVTSLFLLQPLLLILLRVWKSVSQINAYIYIEIIILNGNFRKY